MKDIDMLDEGSDLPRGHWRSREERMVQNDTCRGNHLDSLAIVLGGKQKISTKVASLYLMILNSVMRYRGTQHWCGKNIAILHSFRVIEVEPFWIIAKSELYDAFYRKRVLLFLFSTYNNWQKHPRKYCQVDFLLACLSGKLRFI